jgi:hypothetical protein
MPITKKLIAPCGMNCALCLAHLREKNPCHGCNDAEQNKPKTRAHCKLRLCTKRKGKFCFDCTDFPCDRLQHLDERYRTRYGMSMVDNLEYLKQFGMAKFIFHEQQRWVKGDKIYCVHKHKYYEQVKS